MKIKVRVVRAIDDSETTWRYIDGHLKVLESYGVTKVTSADTSWVSDPNVYLIIFESVGDKRILGGGRIQIRSSDFPMPLENAIAEIDNSIYDYMARFGEHEVAEYCGLWNSKEVAGYGIGSIYLVRIGVAIAAILNLKRIFALCSPATVKISKKVGYRVIEELGKNGEFLYPKEGLIATILQIEDLENLPFAEELEKEMILKMRDVQISTINEIGPKGTMELQFELTTPVVKL